MLLGFAIAFMVWQVPTVLDEVLTGRIPNQYGTYLTILAAAAGVVWLVFAISYLRTARAIARDPNAAAALDDERLRDNRSRSYAVGFWTLGGLLIMTRLLSMVWDVSVSAVSQVGLMLAVVVPIVTFLLLERE
ncbi:MAG TPA: hypothetical protein VKA86_00060 [Candidatus Krumholzibacteria bacterium]|nr:hypothetical protein [Candidatus Krumholzibacteria bacterium]